MKYIVRTNSRSRNCAWYVQSGRTLQRVQLRTGALGGAAWAEMYRQACAEVDPPGR